MNRLFVIFTLCFATELFSAENYPSVNLPAKANPVKTYEGHANDPSDVMVDIPLSERVYNRTGIQCVWSTLETLGRFADEPKLFNLSTQKDCQAFGNPKSVAAKLNKFQVKFEQSNNHDRKLILKSVVNERRGCLFSVPNHVMTLVHYDEQKGIVKYINNSDELLEIRTWTMEEFNKRWEGWICVIYADRDIVPLKYIPIIDRNGRQKKYSNDYILNPKK